MILGKTLGVNAGAGYITNVAASRLDSDQLQGWTVELRWVVPMRIRSPYSDGDSYRCVASLRSELRIVKTLLNLSKRCLSPTLKRHAIELHERKAKLKKELKIRFEEEKLRVISNHSEFGVWRTTSLKKARNVTYRTVLPIR
jgi:hypothetical protein